MARIAGDKLHIKDVTLLTANPDKALERLYHQEVAVYDGRFLYVGSSERDCIQALERASDEQWKTIDGSRRWLLSGFANTHTHMAMSLFRNASDDLALHDWLNNVIFPREAKLTDEDVYCGNLLASLEMIRSGTTMAADMYFFPDAALNAAKESGLRLNIAIDPMLKVDGGFDFKPELLLNAKKRAEAEADLNLVNIDLQIHSLYLYPESAYSQLKDFAASEKLRIQIHIAETKREEEELLERYNMRPAELAEHWGLMNGPMVAAHGVYLNDTDRAIYAGHGTVLSHNPASNLKLASGIAEITKAIEAGVAVSLATDGAASNNSLDMYKEVYLASLLAKAKSADPRALPAWRSWQLATLDGYRAFDIDGGRIETGAVADFQLLDTDDERFITDQDPAAVLVYTIPKDLVRTVVVGGKLLYHDAAFVYLDEERIRFEAKRIATRFISS